MRSLSASGVLAILLSAPAANAAQFTYDVFGELQREDFGGSIVGAMTFLEGAATPFDVDLTYIGDFVFRDISYEGPIRFTEIDEERTSRSFSGFVFRREGDGDLVDETGRPLFSSIFSASRQSPVFFQIRTVLDSQPEPARAHA